MSGAVKRTGAAVALAAGLLLVAIPARGQDVIMRGRMHGTPIPDWILRKLERNPHAFQFKRAWIQKAERIRARRASERTKAAKGYFTPSAMAQAGPAMTGVLSVPVVLGLYSDASAPYTPPEYETKLFGEGTGSYTLKTFYNELSRGVFEVDGAAHGWFVLPETAAHYEEPSGSTDPKYGRTREFLRDALVAADPNVDFAQYDNDGPDGVPNSGDDDGFVDVTAFLYPTWGKNCGGTGIWPHRFVYEAWWGQPFETDDASVNGGFIQVSDYIIQGGVACDGSSIMEIGTIAHELGHSLGLPDLYDTNAANGESQGIGVWGLMGAGNYNTPASPAHMTAWSKVELGWIPVVTVSQDSSVSLEPAENTGPALRLNVPGSPGEYFLLENRQPIGSDQNLRAGGLLVWHVDSTVIENNRTINEVNGDETHKGLDLEAADGRTEMDDNASSGDAGDPFPGATANTLFTGSTDPNSDLYAGFSSEISLLGIQEVSGDMTFEILVGAAYWGDVTQNDVIDVNDAEAIYTDLVGGSTSANMLLADVDADGDVDARDALIVHSYAAGVDLSGCAECRVGEEVGSSGSAPAAITLHPESPNGGTNRAPSGR